ncbi:MAG: Hsp20/alpha crystallin family protein [Armatimonadota bacterium]
MDKLAPWGQFGDMRRMREHMDRLFSDIFSGRPWPMAWPAEGEGRPTVDVYETEGEVVVQADVPGMKKEDLEISATEDGITIRGESKREKEVEEEGYHRRERYYGRFARTVPTPTAIDADQTKAKFRDGVLEIRAPKLSPPEAKGQKIAID